MRKLLVIGVSALALSAGAVAYAAQSSFAPKSETFRMLELFGDVLAVVEQQYVVEVDDKKLIEAALNGMLTSLDPHSNYMNPEEYNDLRERARGQYSGVGLEITVDNNLVKVITPMDEGPAAKAGVQAGDVITSIDGENTVGMTLKKAGDKLRGAMGTKVQVTFAREGEEKPIERNLTREVINLKSVRERVEGDYGVVRISSFNENTGQETVDALNKLRAQKPDMKGVVLDLRNNPGGILEQSVAVADAFLEGGEIVSQRGRDPRDIERYNATPGDLAHGLPVVVLINYGSASAAEIVAGALKDHERATVVGLTSFGKGSVQTVMPLRSGRDGALRLTTARYYTPSGRSIQKTGIEPDLEVARSVKEAEIVSESNFIYSEAAYSNALDAAEKAERKGPHKPTEAPPAGFDEKKDFQLERAFQVLSVKGDLKALPKIAAPVPAKVAEAPAAAVKK
ncbi:S41 family peptidase [Caulobacter sp. 17J80-11]|uniref:S41 family peptidase n=1 Tax=Caulobacter sp. 17J80-11 TaxID=2763502 RepID=UPI001653E133|nr:S41 family peptidase [Caulobacter sp. 17J80-11]MBC6983649.1 S41 family peptidase [Caulobacter sp. 17J80-11]